MTIILELEPVILSVLMSIFFKIENDFAHSRRQTDAILAWSLPLLYVDVQTNLSQISASA
jgi:hypothetical protein